MKKLHTRKILFIFFSLFYIFPLNACAVEHQEHPTNISDLSSLVKELSELFLAGTLTVDSLEKKFSATAEQAENKEYWSVDSNKYNVRSTVKASDKNSALEELTLYTNGLRQLKLKDLEKIFGNSRVIVRSRDPWVEFAGRKNQNGKNVSITAKLYAPPEAEISPVTTFELSLE